MSERTGVFRSTRGAVTFFGAGFLLVALWSIVIVAALKLGWIK